MAGRTLLRRLLLTAVIMMGFLAHFSIAATAGSGAWTVLNSGHEGSYLWSVKATRSSAPSEAGAQGAPRPCLLIRAKWELGPFSFRGISYRKCADVAEGLAATAPPLVASGTAPSRGDRTKLTAVGMIFAPAVRSVRITSSRGEVSRVVARSSSSQQSRTAELGRFKYAAFSVRGPWCAASLATIGSSGRVLWEGEIDATC